jgi:hypothetical protein
MVSEDQLPLLMSPIAPNSSITVDLNMAALSGPVLNGCLMSRHHNELYIRLYFWRNEGLTLTFAIRQVELVCGFETIEKWVWDAKTLGVTLRSC